MIIDRDATTERFRKLHVKGSPLVLANAWDPVSAAVLERAGFEAAATTSGGMAWTNGVPDGNSIAAETLLDSVAQILSVITVPLSVDIEGGLSHDVGDVASLASMLADRGVAGVNLEDSWDGALLPLSQQQERLSAVRAAAAGLFLNARVDTFFSEGDDRARLEETIVRAGAFVEAGADGVFVPGLTDLELIRELVSRAGAPVNIMTSLDGPAVAELAAVGVSRVSLGTALAEAAYSYVYDLAVRFRAGELAGADRPSLTYSELNALLER